MEFLEVKCPSCGGDLKVPEDRSTFICGYCGTTIMVRDAYGKGVLNPENLIKLAYIYFHQKDYDAADLTFNKALEIDAENFSAWEGKLRSMWHSQTEDEFKKGGKDKYLSLFKTCFEYASEKDYRRLESLMLCYNMGYSFIVELYNEVYMCLGYCHKLNIITKRIIAMTKDIIGSSVHRDYKERCEEDIRFKIKYPYFADYMNDEINIDNEYLKKFAIEINKYIGFIVKSEPEYTPTIYERAILQLIENNKYIGDN